MTFAKQKKLRYAAAGVLIAAFLSGCLAPVSERPELAFKKKDDPFFDQWAKKPEKRQVTHTAKPVTRTLVQVQQPEPTQITAQVQSVTPKASAHKVKPVETPAQPVKVAEQKTLSAEPVPSAKSAAMIGGRESPRAVAPAKSAPPAELVAPAKSAPPAELVAPAKSAPPAELVAPAKSAPPAELVAPAKSAPPAELVAPPRQQQLPTQRITLNIKQADIVVVLRTLAKAADQNILIGPGVKGIIDVNLNNVPWDQAFTGVLRTERLTYKSEGAIIRIMTMEDVAHELALEKSQQQQQALKAEFRKVEPLQVQTVKVNFTNARKLTENLEKLFTGTGEGGAAQVAGQGEKRGSVAVDEDNNTIIIHDIKDNIAKMNEVIAILDAPTYQVLIEAKIVETNTETARELGVQWGGLRRSGNNWITAGDNSTGMNGQALFDGSGNAIPVNPTSGIAGNFPVSLTDGGAGLTLGYVYERLGEQLLSAQLSALEEQGKLNILSNPSITTLDNQKATIESGEQAPFATIDEDGQTDVEWKNAVLQLEVTPHVINGKLVKLEVSTKKDEFDRTNLVQGNPTILTKKATTNLILHNGETTVIGGLTKETTSENTSGVPWLSNIPVLGYLFKSEGKSRKMNELLIFITPHILEYENSGKQLKAEKRPDGMRRQPVTVDEGKRG